VWSEIELAARVAAMPLVGVTGTNGKTTTTEFLTHALAAAGRDATAAGNIGFPLSQLVVDRSGGGPDSIAVCEVSSFQSETFRHFRADSVIWTNFAEDHLERHGTMEAYFLAKWRLLERCIGGHVHVGTSVRLHAEQFGQTLPAEACVSTEREPGDILLQGTLFADYPQRENFLLISAWWRAGARPACARAFSTRPPAALRSPATGWKGWGTLPAPPGGTTPKPPTSMPPRPPFPASSSACF
jgi:UDP-N-acetylmuramoylalanine--D-glutamate ligase